MAVRPWHLLSLCDGYGGTELALRSVARVRTVARVERDAYAAAVLVERMEEARLDLCPVWDDVATFDGRPWRGRVDIVAAGFPCPDFSSAGKRAGVDGEHWLWPECFEVIRQVAPRFVLLENVPGLVRLGGLTRVLSDLADDGFDAEWGVLAAAAVGAPHERERIWIVAHRDGIGSRGQRDALRQSIDGTEARGCSDDVAHTHDNPRRNWRLQLARGTDVAEHASDVGHADRSGRATHPSSSSSSQGPNARRRADGDHVTDRAVEDVGGRSCFVGSGAAVAGVITAEPGSMCPSARAVGHAPRGGCVQGDGPATRFGRSDGTETTTCWPPGRDDHAGWQQWIAAGGPQPVLRRITDGPPGGLADALHLGGNGLVPQCAAHAWRQLLERGGWMT